MSAQTSTSNAVAVADGFDAIDPTSSPIRGVDTRFKDGAMGILPTILMFAIERSLRWTSSRVGKNCKKDCPPEYVIQKTENRARRSRMSTKKTGRRT